MSIDDELRSALHHRAERIEPEAGSWDRIQEQVGAERRRHRTRTGARAGLGVAAAAALVMGSVALFTDDPRQVVETTGPAAPVTSTTTITEDVGEPSRASAVPGIWPLTSLAQIEAYQVSGETRWDDPVEVTRAFAVDYLGMVDPVVGEARPVSASGEADAGAVEVVLRPRGESGAPVASGALDTTVTLGPLGEDGAGPWNVVSASARNIEVPVRRVVTPFGQPPFGFSEVTSPLFVSGLSSAYEGTFYVEVRQSGMEVGEALAETFLMGGAGAELESFSGSISFEQPTTDAGALVLFTISTATGATEAATVIDVSFARPSTAGTSEVTVFLLRGEEVVPVTRPVPATSGVLRAALEQLLAGPTATEEAEGSSSMFSSATAGMLRSVTIDDDGLAVVDFADLRALLPAVGTSAASSAFLGQLNATVFQFPTVSAVEYRIEGSCETFWEWHQYESSCPLPRPGA